jgi:MFS transporter, UMF1 family
VDPQPATFGLARRLAATRLSFISVGVWWLVFSIPLLRRCRSRPVLEADETGREHALRAAFVRLWETFHELRGYRQAFLMLVAFLLYNDGIQTIIRMAAIYGAEIGIDRNAQIAAFAGAVRRRAVLVPLRRLGGPHRRQAGDLPGAGGLHRGISILGYFMSTAWHFFVLAFLVGMVQGGSQALSRSLFARMIPKHKSSEFFGFFSVFEKFAGIAGPALFAASVRSSARAGPPCSP